MQSRVGFGRGRLGTYGRLPFAAREARSGIGLFPTEDGKLQ